MAWGSTGLYEVGELSEGPPKEPPRVQTPGRFYTWRPEICQAGSLTVMISNVNAPEVDFVSLYLVYR